jgi:cytochrome c oxidase cbb3-type subunit 4
MTHETLVWFAKYIGLLYLLALSAVVLAFACRPANRHRFERAARSILADDARP